MTEAQLDVDVNQVLKTLEKERERKRRYYHHNREKMLIQQKTYKKRKREGGETDILLKGKKTPGVVERHTSSDFPIIVLDGESKQMAKRRVWIEQLSLFGYDRCWICGFNEHQSAIDYHHFDINKTTTRSLKVFSRNPTRERIKVLTNETVPLCANCHRIHHNTNSGYSFDEINIYYG